MGTASDTRREARPGREAASRRRQLVLECLRTIPQGMTAGEIATVLGWDVTSVRPRLTELVKRGLAEWTEQRRETRFGKSAKVARAVRQRPKQQELF